MYWLLLPIAGATFIIALRMPSLGMMLFWLLLSFAAVGAWVWFRYRALFPKRDAALHITPLDPAELARLRQQVETNRIAEAARRAEAEEEALHPIHPVAHPQPVSSSIVQPAAASTPAAIAAQDPRPLTGRAVFLIPDQPLPDTTPSGQAK